MVNFSGLPTRGHGAARQSIDEPSCAALHLSPVLARRVLAPVLEAEVSDLPPAADDVADYVASRSVGLSSRPSRESVQLQEKVPQESEPQESAHQHEFVLVSIHESDV